MARSDTKTSVEDLVRLITAQNETIDSLGQDIIDLKEKVESQSSVIGVTEINANLTFEKCISAAIEGIATQKNIFQISRNPDHLKSTVSSIVDLAEALQEELSKRYEVKV